MPDLFHDRAADYDARPVPQQISEGVYGALAQAVALTPALTVLDFGAGTGLLTGRVAPHVGRVHAVDVSPAMLAQLAQKPELAGKVEIHCQDLLLQPLAVRADLVVSAMAMHHVADTAALLRALYQDLAPGGRIALADLDAEEGDFHPPGIEGVFHAGFDRAALGALAEQAGFTDVRFATACTVTKEAKHYPVFLLTATR